MNGFLFIYIGRNSEDVKGLSAKKKHDPVWLCFFVDFLWGTPTLSTDIADGLITAIRRLTLTHSKGCLKNEYLLQAG
jgi:hypothetical protein